MANIKSAKAQENIASSEYFPELYFNANYKKQNADEFKDSLPQTQYAATINFDWNLYQGGSTTDKTQEKRIQTAITESELINLKLTIKDEVAQAFINVYKAKDSVELSQSLLEVSEEKFDQAQKRYEHGLSDYIELQQARQGYIDSMSSLIVNYYNYYKAIAVLDNAIGR